MARDLKVRWTGDSSGAEQAARKVADSTTGLGAVMDGVHSRARTAFGGVSAAIGAAGLPLGPLQGAIDSMGGAWERSGGKAATAGKVMAGVGVGLAGIGAIALKFAEPLEKAHAELQRVVENTGTSFSKVAPQVDELDKHMEHFGHRSSDTEEALSKLTAATNSPTEAMKEMSVVSEIAAYHHTSLAAAAEQVAKIHGGSTRALKEFGINVKDLGAASKTAAADERDHQKAMDEVTKSQDKLAAAQKHLSDLEAIDAGKKKLTIADEQHLRDARDAVAKATSDLSTAQEREKGTAENAARSAQAASAAHMDTARVLDIVHQKIKGVDEAQADTFGGKLAAARAHIEDFAAAVGEHAGKALIAFGPAIAGVGGILESGIIGKFGSAAKAIGSGAVSIAKFGVAAVEAGIEGAAAAIPFLIAWGPIILAVAAVAAAAYLIVDNWSSIAGFFKDLWGDIENVVTTVADDIWGFLKTWGLLILELLTPAGWIALIVQHWSQISGVIKAGLDLILGFVRQLPGQILSLLADAASWLVKVGGDIVHGLWQGLELAAHIIWEWEVGLPLRILGLLVQAGTWLIDTGVHILQGLWNGLEQGAVAVWNWYTSLPGRILGVLGDVGSWLFNTGMNIINGLIRGIENAINGVWGFFTSMPGAIWAALGDVGRWLWNTGIDLIQGLINGIESMAGNLASSVVNTVEKAIPGPIKDVLGIGSPSRLMMEYGGYVVQGLQLGIQSQQGALADQVARMAGLVTAPFPISAPQLPVLPGALAGAAGPGTPGGAAAAGRAQQVTYEVHLGAGSIVVQGHVLTEQDLVDVIHSGLVQKFRREGDLQITAAG